MEIKREPTPEEMGVENVSIAFEKAVAELGFQKHSTRFTRVKKSGIGKRTSYTVAKRDVKDGDVIGVFKGRLVKNTHLNKFKPSFSAKINDEVTMI